MTEFAHVSFDNYASRRSLEVLQSMGLELATVHMPDDRWAVAVWAADYAELVAVRHALVGDRRFKRLVKLLGTARLAMDGDGGWLLTFTRLVGRREVLH